MKTRLVTMATLAGQDFNPSPTTLVVYATSKADIQARGVVAAAVLTHEGDSVKLATFSDSKCQEPMLRQQLVSRLLTAGDVPVTARLVVAASDSVALAELRYRNFESVTAIF